MKVSIDLDSADAAGLKRARAMIDKLARDAEACEKHERKARALPANQRALLKVSVFDLGLAHRTSNALHAQGISTLNDLIACTAAGLRKYPNIGNTSLNEIRAALVALGLDLSPNERGRPLGAITKDE